MELEDLRDLHQSLEVGQVDTLLSALPGLEAGDEASLSAARAFRAGLYLAGHPEGLPIDAGVLSPRAGIAAPYVRLFGVFFARLRGDVAALDHFARVDAPASALDALAARLAHDWGALWRGEQLSDADLTDLEDQARQAGFGDLAVEFTVLRALSASAMMRFDEALIHARRASRMGHTEHRPQSEYAAHIVLARARRHRGMPYLAARILTSLASVLPSPWRGWANLELALSSHSGDLRELDSASGPGWMRTELADLFACLDAKRSPASEQARAWIEGEGALPPWGIHAVAGDDIGYVCVKATRPSYRTLARPTFGRLLMAEEREPRTERGLGALAFSEGRTLEVDAFFEEVYGFEFDQGLHGSWLRTLLMRMRKAVEGVADIERVEDSLRLVSTSDFCVRDPRCALDPAEQVLQLIASDGAMGARQAAGKLGVPLRTVQRTLKTLVDEGICQADRSARKVVYKIEDTTFHEPTTSYRANYKK